MRLLEFVACQLDLVESTGLIADLVCEIVLAHHDFVHALGFNLENLLLQTVLSFFHLLDLRIVVLQLLFNCFQRIC